MINFVHGKHQQTLRDNPPYPLLPVPAQRCRAETNSRGSRRNNSNYGWRICSSSIRLQQTSASRQQTGAFLRRSTLAGRAIPALSPEVFRFFGLPCDSVIRWDISYGHEIKKGRVAPAFSTQYQKKRKLLSDVYVLVGLVDHPHDMHILVFNHVIMPLCLLHHTLEDRLYKGVYHVLRKKRVLLDY